MEGRSDVVLTLTIDNSEPIELGAFVNAFTSIAEEYRESLGKSGINGDAEIFISEVRKGSIVADLVPAIVSALPVVSVSINQIAQSIDFVKAWAERLEFLKKGKVFENASSKELKAVCDMTEAIARDPSASSKLELVTYEDKQRKVRAAFKFDSSEARVIQETAKRALLDINAPTSTEHRRVFLYFTRSDKGQAPIDKNSGERAVIEEISDKSRPVIYSSELAEEQIKDMLQQESVNIFKKGFNVDVSVVERNGRTVAYKILGVHQVIDLEEE